MSAGLRRQAGPGMPLGLLVRAVPFVRTAARPLDAARRTVHGAAFAAPVVRGTAPSAALLKGAADIGVGPRARDAADRGVRGPARPAGLR